MGMDEIIESELIQLICAGNAKAFEEIYYRYKKSVFGFIIKYVRSVDIAEDLTQEIFIKIWEQKEKLKDIRSFRSYLFTLSKNHTLNGLKKIANSENAVNHLLFYAPIEEDSTVWNFQFKEYSNLINRTLKNMPERTMQIFKLCREEGKSYEEAAALIGVSQNAIKNHMVSAMKTFKKMIAQRLDITLILFLLYCYTS